MSRIGKKPVSVPSGVRVTIDPQSRTVTAEGPKGKLSMTHRPEVAVTWDEGENRIICSIGPAQKRSSQLRAYWGLTRSLINNMIIGVTDGYTRKLEIIGVGWGAKLQGKQLELNVGYCQPRVMPVPDNINLVVEKGVIKKRHGKLKVLGDGKLSRKLVVEAARFSAGARRQIEELGGEAITV